MKQARRGFRALEGLKVETVILVYDSLLTRFPGYGPDIFVNRPVRTRMPGGVGAGGEKPPATRLLILIWSTSLKVLI